jgi:hypothetical protein
VTHVRDGDTLELGGMAIRLQGLAAPEGDESGDAEATKAIRPLVDGRRLRCELNGEPRWFCACRRTTSGSRAATRGHGRFRHGDRASECRAGRPLRWDRGAWGIGSPAGAVESAGVFKD